MKKIWLLFFIGIAFNAIQAIGHLKLQKNTVLLGSITFQNHAEKSLAMPILYKGNEYKATIETHGDTRKAHFELYDAEVPQELYFLVTEYLATPENPYVQHLETSPEHEYRLFKLTRYQLSNLETQTHKQATSSNNIEQTEFSSWHIQEEKNIKKSRIIPDNTIILLGINPSYIDSLRAMPWAKESAIVFLPTIIMNDMKTASALEDLTAKMKIAVMDFMFLHPKLNQKTSKPVASNCILSMPTNQHRLLL